MATVNTPVFYLDSMISLLATGVYVVTRSNASTYTNGMEVVDPAPTTLNVQCVVNPLPAIELLRMPEARRTSDFREVFSTLELKTASDANAADTIVIDGLTFEVERSERWNLMGDVYRSIVQRAARLGAT